MQGYICPRIKLALSHLLSKILIRSNEFGRIATISDGTIQNVRTLACNNLSFHPTHKQKSTSCDVLSAGGEGWIRLIAERANRVCKSEASTQTNCAIALCVLHTRHFVYICLLCPLRTISANATRLRPSLLAVSTERRFDTQRVLAVFFEKTA